MAKKIAKISGYSIERAVREERTDGQYRHVYLYVHMTSESGSMTCTIMCQSHRVDDGWSPFYAPRMELRKTDIDLDYPAYRDDSERQDDVRRALARRLADTARALSDDIRSAAPTAEIDSARLYQTALERMGIPIE